MIGIEDRQHDNFTLDTNATNDEHGLQDTPFNWAAVGSSLLFDPTSTGLGTFIKFWVDVELILYHRLTAAKRRHLGLAPLTQYTICWYVYQF